MTDNLGSVVIYGERPWGAIPKTEFIIYELDGDKAIAAYADEPDRKFRLSLSGNFLLIWSHNETEIKAMDAIVEFYYKVTNHSPVNNHGILAAIDYLEQTEEYVKELREKLKNSGYEVE